ncbi:MAG TPA: hypothetical protein VF195_08730 [Actinomycetota bacterium]
MKKMKGQLNVKTRAEHIAAVDDERRSDIAALDAVIRKHAPKLEPVIRGGMLGYGPFRHRYASGREGDACRLDRQQRLVYLAVLLRRRREGLPRRAVRRPAPEGQHRQGLVRFKKLADLDEKALVARIKETA